MEDIIGAQVILPVLMKVSDMALTVYWERSLREKCKIKKEARKKELERLDRIDALGIKARKSYLRRVKPGII
jgi:hypothetical protein